MTKQFNFYDIYGYLLPGMLLLSILWLPIGVFTKIWPDQDLSKSLFLAALAYILGLLVQSVAESLMPSTVIAGTKRRAPSDLLLDPNNPYFSNDFKKQLADQITKLFGLSVALSKNGNGEDETSANRQAAFYQSRSYLIAKKAANYAEQFQGLYAMMRGLCCSFCAGAAYLAGWGLAFHRNCICVSALMAVLSATALGGTFLSICWLKVRKNLPLMRYLWLGFFGSAGFWVSFTQPKGLQQLAPARFELILWASMGFAVIAATKCFYSYRKFADIFAQTVWRDFSACLSYQETSAQPTEPLKPIPEDTSGEV